MARTSIRFGFALLVSGIAIAASEPAVAAGTVVRASFSGTGFSGWLQYDQSQAKKSNGDFLFSSTDQLDHEIWYQIGSATPVYATGSMCSSFEIFTSGGGEKIFQLNVTIPNVSTVVVILPTAVKLSQTSLPLCTSGTNEVFVAAPTAGTSTFKVTPAGRTATTSNIASVTCALQAAVAPSRQLPPADKYVVHTYPYVVHAYPAPTPSPVYVCQPRPACCMSRLFCSGWLRLCRH
jgi:hypothetical protein